MLFTTLWSFLQQSHQPPSPMALPLARPSSTRTAHLRSLPTAMRLHGSRSVSLFTSRFHSTVRHSNESFSLGRVAEQMGDLEHALSAYENALRHNPNSLPGLTQVAGIARIKENYPKVGIPSIHLTSPSVLSWSAWRSLVWLSQPRNVAAHLGPNLAKLSTGPDSRRYLRAVQIGPRDPLT